MSIHDLKTKYALILSIILLLLPFTCLGEVIVKVGESSYTAPALTYQEGAVWSPQGNKILLVTNKDTNYDNIVVINSDGSNYQRLTDDTTSAITAMWSNDGNTIYYRSYSQGLESLCSMNSSGGQKSVLVQAPENHSIYQFSLAPNGAKIAYLVVDNIYETASLYVMNTNGSNITELTKATPNYFGGFSWSSDSTEIMYYYSDSSHLILPSFHRVTIDNTADTEFITLSRSQAPKWQPNGNKILYFDYTDDNQIFSINSDGSGNMQLTAGQGYIDECSWSPDGTKILFEATNDDYETEIWNMNTDGTSKTKLATFSFYGIAFWSADSTKIAFSDFQNMWVINSDGTNSTKITANTQPFWNFSPAFNGNYQKLVFCSIYPDKYTMTVIKTNDTSPQEILSTTDSIGDVSWNPVSEQIIYCINGIWSINSDGSGNVQLATTAYNPKISPNGAKIAYSNYSADILTMNPDGSNKTALTTGSVSTRPDWSPSGDRIVYERYSNVTHGYDICTMRADGTEQTNLTNGTDYTYHTLASWSLDGTKIAYFVRRSPGNTDNGLWVMDTDGNNKKHLDNFYPAYIPPKWNSSNRIYYVKSYPMSRVYSIKPDGTDLRVESGDNIVVEDFALAPNDTKIVYLSSNNVFVKSEEEQIIPADSVDSNILTIGNNVFNPASGQKTNIFIPTKLHDITVKIFTITGALVKKFESVSSPSISWDGKNEDGETVASGVYLVILESLEKTQKDKIIILK